MRKQKCRVVLALGLDRGRCGSPWWCDLGLEGERDTEWVWGAGGAPSESSPTGCACGQSAERPVPSRCSFSFSFIWLQRRACFLFICLLTLMFLLGKWPISPLLAFPLLIFRSTLHITDMTSTSLYALQILVLSQSVVDLLSLFIHL